MCGRLIFTRRLRSPRGIAILVEPGVPGSKPEMKRISLLLLLGPLWAVAQPGGGAGRPVLEKREPQLVYLLSFEETTRMVNEEFERTNTDEVKNRRKAALKIFADSVHTPTIPGDTYAVAVNENIVMWMNETLRKICEGMPEKNYVVVNSQTLPGYGVDNYRYVLRYKYVFDNGDPIKAKMVFYYHDRVEHKDMTDSRALAGKNTYYPFFYYKGEKSYPFYGMIRSSRIRKEWNRFFRSL